MKNFVFKLVLTLLCLMYVLNSKSQGFCFTDQTIIPTLPPVTNGFDNGPPVPINMKVYFFVIRRTDKTGGWLPNDVFTSYNILVNDFSPYQINFNWDGCIKYINDDDLYYEDGREIDLLWLPNYTTASNGTVQVSYEDGISVFLFPDDHTLQGTSGGGFAIGTRMLVSGTLEGIQSALSSVLSHEMGHIFGLLHTHYGCEANNWDLTTDPESWSLYGDMISDTPPDPGIFFNVDENCQWTGEYEMGCEIPEPITNYNPSTDNYMAYVPPTCMTNFTNGQKLRMYSFITILPALISRNSGLNPQPMNQCACEPEDIIINEDRTITSDLYLTGDLKILAGANLIIQNCSVFFNSGKGIKLYENAKLTIDGGHITACEGELWAGIQVAGGNTDYDVKIMNQSIIENTSAAAVSMFAPYNYPQITQYGNGILHAENSTFINTRRMAEFMAWTQSNNSSYINNCTQIGGKWGVTNWNCNDIKIDNCTFTDITHYGIVLVDGNIEVEGTTFICGEEDILINHTTAARGSMIESNYFLGSNNGIKSRGGAESENIIENNIFQNGGFNIFNDGSNSNKIRRNSISSLFGALNIDCGSPATDYVENEFVGNAAGLIISGSNNGTNFFQNCFTTTFTDAYIEGIVYSPIGNNDLAADNCFTHQGASTSQINDISGSTGNLLYLVPDDAISDCRDVLNPQISTSIAISSGIPDCGSSLPNGPIPYNFCNPKKTFFDIWGAFNWLKNKINEISNNPNLTEKQKEIMKKIYLRCFEKVKAMLFEWHIEQKEFSKAREIYNNDTSKISKVLVFSSYVHENNLTEARSYLNSLEIDDNEISDFVFVQNVNLNRIPLGPYYQPTSNELEQVRSIANKNEPLAGYAKSLYFVLTGEIINSPLPQVIHEKVFPRNSINNSYPIKAYPNPFTENITVDIGQNENVVLEILDFYGNIKYKSLIQSNGANIVTSQWDNGIYILRAYSGSQLLQTSKLVLVK